MRSEKESVADDAALRAIVEGVEADVGEKFFASLVRHLAAALGVQYSFVTEISADRKTFRTLAVWGRGHWLDNFEVPLAGTPCEAVLNGDIAHHPACLQQLFPEDKGLVDWNAESYCGVPIVDSKGVVVGHLAIIHDQAMPDGARGVAVMRIFAARARAEIERQHFEQRLRESEERLRDLFDEAPIAYVHEDLESRFIRANRAAMRILGVKPEEVIGTVGRSLIPNTPDAQRRVREAFESIGRGTDTSGVVLELRRKDDGRPIWIQWWSKPDPSGTYTRTMFIDITERVLAEREKSRLEAQNSYLQEEIRSDHNFEEIVGRSRSLREVLDKVSLVAGTDSSVLVLGETGTGKELIARAVHSGSKRRGRPFIKVNCAALPSGLIESELFGHEKGAFTGATERRTGRFQLAHGGSIFLDEVGELPLDLQTKLLRVLQERAFERVGGSETIEVDVRVIAATNRDLAAEVAAGKFRQDLFYRLNVFPVRLPALRERTEDIPLLASYFVARYGAKIGRKITRIPPPAMQRLVAYAWPGNVRELENVIERAVILSPGPDLDVAAETLASPAAEIPRPAPASPGARAAGSPAGSLEDVERAHIVSVLRQTRWRIDGPQGAARILGINPSTLRSRMKKLAIDRDSLDRP
jgi:formate hydrogenlyase transcriptional activator